MTFLPWMWPPSHWMTLRARARGWGAAGQRDGQPCLDAETYFSISFGKAKFPGARGLVEGPKYSVCAKPAFLSTGLPHSRPVLSCISRDVPTSPARPVAAPSHGHHGQKPPCGQAGRWLKAACSKWQSGDLKKVWITTFLVSEPSSTRENALFASPNGPLTMDRVGS